jgi:hypothetical protein
MNVHPALRLRDAVFIYALCEPDTEVAAGELPAPECVRYVGKTDQPAAMRRTDSRTSSQVGVPRPSPSAHCTFR